MSARHRPPPFSSLSSSSSFAISYLSSYSSSSFPFLLCPPLSFPSLLLPYLPFSYLPFPCRPLPSLPFPLLPSPSYPPFPFPSPFGLRVVVGYPLGPQVTPKGSPRVLFSPPLGSSICLRVLFGCSLGTLGGPMSAQRVPEGTPKMPQVPREGVSRKQLFYIGNMHICSPALPLESRKLLFP